MNGHHHPPDFAAPVLVELTRGDLVESIHRGRVCIARSNGEIVFSKGDADQPTFLRSSAKPFQAAAVVLSGAAEVIALTDPEIALLAGSHGGEAIHIEAVTSILAKAGLDARALQCGIHPPLDGEARLQLEHEGAAPTALHHNCSGKHAGMLITARHWGLPIDDYLRADHPVQQRIIALIAEIAGVSRFGVALGTDGCSAPAPALPLQAAAMAFARLVEPVGLEPELARALDRVACAMRAFPEMVAATQQRLCTELMRAGRDARVTAKAGAEGVYCVGWFDRSSGHALGLAVKMEDGGQRGRDPVVIGLLQRYGVLPEELSPTLQPMRAGTLQNWRGLTVGETRLRL